jgi:hypothetical protein
VFVNVSHFQPSRIFCRQDQELAFIMEYSKALHKDVLAYKYWRKEEVSNTLAYYYGVTTLSIMALSIMTLYTDFCYAECR